MASVTTRVMSESYPVGARSEREACAGEHCSARTQEVVDGLILRVEEILDVKGKVGRLDARAAGRERDVGAKVCARVRRVDDRQCREWIEVTIAATSDVQYP